MFSYKDWYQKNKKRLSRKRKQRYRTDPERRSQIRLKSESYYHRVKKKPYIPDRHVIVSGDMHLYTIGRLALLIHRDIGTIRRYHEKGIIPEPTHFDNRGWRLYSRDQVAVLQLCFRRYAQKEIRNLRELRDEIRSKWR